MILSAAQPALFGEFSVRIEVRPIEARPYQLRAVDAARELVRAGEHPLVLVLVTGGGKTTIAAKLILGAHAKGRKALFVAHRREIISQAFWRLAESGVPLTDLGVIQADGVIPLQSGQGRYHAQRPQAPVQVASIQTLARRRLPPADLVFIDECFPAGTLVDGRAIETVAAGEEVDAFDHDAQRVVRRRVARCFRSRPSSLLLVHLDDGRALACTPGHPIYADGDYRPAGTLRAGMDLMDREEADLRGMQRGVRAPLVEQHHDARVLGDLQGEAPSGPTEDRGHLLQGVSLDGGAARSDRRDSPVLLGGVQAEHDPREILPHDGRDQSTVRERADEGSQPDAPGVRACHGGDPSAHAPQAAGAGGQRAPSAGASARARGGARVAHGGHRPDGDTSWQRVADALQDRRGLDGAHGGDRGRRPEPRRDGSEAAGSQEDRVPSGPRVDRVEVLEPGGDGTFGGLCPDGHVYNLEVEELHNYFAGGVLVHNCHHSNASTYAALIHHYTAQGATIIGLTATPVRGDGKGLGDLFRHLHVCAAPAELIEGGWLCAPRVYVGRERADLSKVKVERGDYVVDELAAAVDTNVLVGQIVSEWQRLAQGRTTAVFATNVRHSLHIVEQFKAVGVRAEHLDGETPQDARDAILGRLARGETQLVSNCQVLTEGWDLPRCKCVVLARPTKNEGLYLQMAGRGLRPWEGIEALLLDHARCSERFGLPQDERSWTLEGCSKRKKGTSGSDKKEVLAKACPNCDLVVRAGTTVCPECGVSFPPPELPEEVDGELVELTSTRAALLATERERKKVIRRLAEILEPVIAGGVRDADAWPEANKAVWGLFRKSRTKMSAVELGQVLAALADGGPAHTAILRRLGASVPKASASDLAHLAHSQSATVRRLVEKAREHEIEKRYAPPAKAQELAAPAAPPAAPPQAAPTTVEAFERWSL